MDLMTLTAIGILLTFIAVIATIVSFLNDDSRIIWRIKSEDEDGSVTSHEPLMTKRQAKKSIKWHNRTYAKMGVKTKFFMEIEND